MRTSAQIWMFCRFGKVYDSQTNQRSTPIDCCCWCLNFLFDDALLERIVVEHTKQIFLAHFKPLKRLTILQNCANNGLQFGEIFGVYCFLNKLFSFFFNFMKPFPPQCGCRNRIPLELAAHSRGGSRSSARKPRQECGPSCARRLACLRLWKFRFFSIWLTKQNKPSSNVSNSSWESASNGRSKSQSWCNQSISLGFWK